MEGCNEKNIPRAGTNLVGESRTPSEEGVWPTYTGGATAAMEGEKEVAKATVVGMRQANDDQRLDPRIPIVQRFEDASSRAATPGSIKSSKFFGSEGTSDDGESGHETTNSQIEMEQMRRHFRKRRGSDDVNDLDKSKGAPAPRSIKRGRGRPPTTGQYVGLHQAKLEKAAAERLEERRAQQAEAERLISDKAKELPQQRSHRLSEASRYSDVTMSDEEEEVVTSAKLGSTITKSLEIINMVASKSKNLSGLFVKHLRDATKAIQEATAELLRHSKTEETRALEVVNKRLSRDLAELRTELATLKRELTNVRPQPAPATPALEEMLAKAVREAIAVSSARMDARLEGLEARLLPQPRIRPPLAADKRQEQIQGATSASALKTPKTVAVSEPTVSTLSPPLNPGPALKKKKGKKKSAAAVEAAAARRDAPSTSAAPPQQEWTEVVRKKGKAPKEGKDSKKKVSKKKKGKKGDKLRVPKSAAVVLTLQPEAEKRGVTYKDVLEKAKQRMDFASLDKDMPLIRFKQAVTGARLYEVSGAGCKERADKLAEKLREVMEGEEVRISRPQKCVELRIHGLDDSANAAEIAQAIALPGCCAAADVKVGEIKRDRRGRGMAWVKCPVEAAKKITAPNIRVYVGWTVVRVVLLTSRPMRCYKCHATGHTRATCPNEVDRSGLCFRCGQPGHAAAQCENAQNCALCAASGKPADHSVGSKVCGKEAPKKKRSKKSKTTQKPTTTPTVASEPGVAQMEEQ